LYVASMKSFAEINSHYKIVFAHNPPARVCVGCPLPRGQQLIMDALAYAPQQKSPENVMLATAGEHGDASAAEATRAAAPSAHASAEYLHVQGFSCWAPANIGPYSQYSAACGQVMMAGQIGLDPPTMKLLPNVASQAEVSLRSAHAVMCVGGAANPAQVCCYLCVCVCVCVCV
jgi:enamine deaminase RidA (YjgF/YER057c/UK114 family)